LETTKIKRLAKQRVVSQTNRNVTVFDETGTVFAAPYGTAALVPQLKFFHNQTCDKRAHSTSQTLSAYFDNHREQLLYI